MASASKSRARLDEMVRRVRGILKSCGTVDITEEKNKSIYDKFAELIFVGDSDDIYGVTVSREHFSRDLRKSYTTVINRIMKGKPGKAAKYSKKGKLLKEAVPAIEGLPVYQAYPPNNSSKIVCVSIDQNYNTSFGNVKKLDYKKTVRRHDSVRDACMTHVGRAHSEALPLFTEHAVQGSVKKAKAIGLLEEVKAIDARRMRERAGEFPMLTAIPATPDCGLSIPEGDVLYGDIGTDAGWATPPTEERM